jgi:hypothetical protein
MKGDAHTQLGHESLDAGQALGGSLRVSWRPDERCSYSSVDEEPARPRLAGLTIALKPRGSASLSVPQTTLAAVAEASSACPSGPERTRTVSPPPILGQVGA